MQIISGKGNPLARAAARGEAGQEQAMQQAVAYDLDTLQRLAITETTLSGILTAGCTTTSNIECTGAATPLFLGRCSS